MIGFSLKSPSKASLVEADMTRGTALSVTEVTTTEQLAALQCEWLTLVETGASGACVHNDPRLVALSLAGRPDRKLRILVVRNGSVLVGIAPFYIQDQRIGLHLSVWRFGAFRARVLRLFGESVIVATDTNPRDVTLVIGEHLRHSKEWGDFFLVDGLVLDDRFWAAALPDGEFSRRTGWASSAQRAQKVHHIRLSSGFQEYCKTLSPRTRSNLRRTRRRIFEDTAVRMEVVVDKKSVGSLVCWLDTVRSQSWQGATFGDETHYAASLSELEAVAALGWLRSYVLLRADDPIAYEHGYLYRGVYYGLDCAYRQEDAAQGPGSVLLFSAIEDLHDLGGVTEIDFGFGDLPYKRTFGNAEQDAAIHFFVPSNRWRLFFAIQKGLTTSYEWVRRLLVASRLDRLVRRRIKGKR